MTDWLFIIVGVVLTIGTGFFVASEFALVTLDRSDLEARRAAGENGFSAGIKALTRTSTHLSSAQLGITLTTLLTGWTMEPAITAMIEPVFLDWGIPAGAAPVVSVVVSVSLATIAQPALMASSRLQLSTKG